MADDTNEKAPKKGGLGARLMSNPFINTYLFDFGYDADTSGADSEIGGTTAVGTPTAPAQPKSQIGALVEELYRELDADNDALTTYKFTYEALSMISDDQERRSAAIVMITAKGHPLEVLIAAIDSDLIRLETEVEESLRMHLEEQTTKLEVEATKVQACVDGVAEREASILKYQAEIETLKDEIGVYEQQKAASLQKVEHLKRGMHIVNDNFARARDQISGELGRLRSLLLNL